MSKRDVAILGTVLAGAAAGALLVVHEARRTRRTHLPSTPQLRLAPAIGYQPSAALVPVPQVLAPIRIATYETVRTASVRRRVPRGILVSVALIALALLGFAFARPRITALAAPSDAYPGTTAQISYASSGVGALSYDLDASAKTAATALAAREGTIAVPISQRDVDRGVIVTLRAAGPFGNDARIARINVLARPSPVVRVVRSTAARIDALSLSSTSVASGAEIVARYRSNATAGTVALRDARGGLWQQEPLSPTGATHLHAPVVEHDTPFIVVLHAQRRDDSIEASAGIVVARKPALPPSGPAALGTRVVTQSGALWRTEVKPAWTDTVIVLMARDGSQLLRLTPHTAGTAELRMPVVSAPESYVVSVSYRTGAGRETVIQPILVVPAKPSR
jgi:hypothetical protein